MSRGERPAMIERGRAELSVRRQCTLLRLARSGVYRPPPPPDVASELGTCVHNRRRRHHRLSSSALKTGRR
jgi:hypothetical protein